MLRFIPKTLNWTFEAYAQKCSIHGKIKFCFDCLKLIISIFQTGLPRIPQQWGYEEAVCLPPTPSTDHSISTASRPTQVKVHLLPEEQCGGQTHQREHWFVTFYITWRNFSAWICIIFILHETSKYFFTFDILYFTCQYAGYKFLIIIGIFYIICAL